jgi:predicted transcriptional regulator
MTVEDLINFIKKRGINDTFQILSQYENNKIEKRVFYDNLNKFSYYNSFLRVKNKLIEKKLINIEKNNGKTYIGLTEKGKIVLDKLIELNKLIKT